MTAGILGYILKNECSDDTILAYYLADFAIPESLDPVMILNSIIKQFLHIFLSAPDKISRDTCTALEETYRDPRNPGRYNPDTLGQHPRRLCQAFRKVFLVIDGLDELKKADRTRVLLVLRSLIKTGQSGLMIKLLISSRLEIDVTEKLRPSNGKDQRDYDITEIVLGETDQHFRLDMELHQTASGNEVQ